MAAAIAGFPVVIARGSPYEVGRIHGAAVAPVITREVVARGGARTAASREHAYAQAAGLATVMQRWAPHLLDEVRGIADGAGIALNVALWLQGGAPGLETVPAGCTAFIVGPDHSGDGAIYAGQNKDTGVGANERSIILLVKPEGRPGVLSFSYAGHLAQFGISDRGLSLWGMSLYPDGPARGGGGAAGLFKRMLLECGSVAEARELMDAFGHGDVGAQAVSDGDGNCGVMEHLGDKHVWLDGGRASIAHANMIASPDPADRARDRWRERTPSSGPRHERINALVAAHRGRFSVNRGFELLGDHAGAPASICRHDPSFEGIQTNAGIVTEPLAGRLHASYGPPCSSSRQTVSFATA